MRTAQTTSCTHRWMLGQPQMAKVRAVCRRCGSHRTYPSGLVFPEPTAADDDPYRSRALFTTDTAAAFETPAQASVAAALSGAERYGSVAAERI